jgi:CheY-like chemotaxis protein
MSRFLVVDDNEAFAENLAEILCDAGNDATVATSGQLAIELVRHEHFDALVSDMRMPEMSGTEVMKRVRAIDPGLPVVVVTAYSGNDDLEVVARAGVLGVLPKPVPVPSLLEILGSARRNGVVAVVDDDRALVDNVSEVLRQHGYAPVAATTVEEAGALADVPLFAAIVDLRLPNAPDGEAVRLLASHFPALPIVIATGFPDLETPIAPRRTMTKPFSPASLLSELDQLHASITRG